MTILTTSLDDQTALLEKNLIELQSDGPSGAIQMHEHWENFSKKEKLQILNEASINSARNIAADLIHSELAKSGKGLRQIERECGLQPAVISRVTTGKSEQGPDLATLFKIAMALGKTVNITFEDPIIDND